MAGDSTINVPAQVLVQAQAAVAAATKTAKEAVDALTKAPAAVPSTEIDKTASLLVEHGWIPKEREAEMKQALADPAKAMLALQNVVVKAASHVALDPRLTAGQAVPDQRRVPTTKQASADGLTDVDRAYVEKVNSYRLNGKV